ncbi:polysaccharide deacetylase family sporulation protein PdaB [Clostridium carnis]
MKRRYRVITSVILLISLVTSSILLRDKYQKVSADITEEGPIYRVQREDKAISLTFDINWAENDELYSILEVLDKYNVKATFFIMGGWVNYSDDNREKLKKINEGGHEIGNHSYIHPMFTKISEERIKSELDKTDKIIEETIGVKPNVFRFPSGDYNNNSYKIVSNYGYKCIQWDVDSVDWKQKGAEIEYERVMKKVKPGSILLFHNNAKYTPGNLDRIIKELQDNGYVFLKVGEILYPDNYIIDDQGEQRKK